MKRLHGKSGFATWLSGITLVAFVLRLYRLAAYLPTRDDYLAVLTADRYMATGQPNPIMPFHPVLRNILTWASLEVFGNSALGAKFFSVLFGALLATAVGLFVRSAVQRPTVALVAAALVAIDPLIINYSRQGIQEVYAAFFAVLGSWLVLESLPALAGDPTKARQSWRTWLLPLSGIVFGLGLASKAYVVFPMAVSFLLACWHAYRRRVWSQFPMIAAAFVVLPAAIYLATYLPWFGRGYDLGEWFTFQSGVFEAMTTHDKPALGFFANNEPAAWFLRPFYSYGDYAMTAAGPQLAIALGNPVTWLLVLPSAVYSLLSRDRRRRDWLLNAFFWASYLPLAFSPRPIWILSAVSVVPFAMPLVASMITDAWRRSQGAGRVLVVSYGAVVLLAAALLYPAATGRALEFEYLRPLVTGLHLGDIYSQ